MRLFAKSVTDPDVCFCQNVVEILSALSRVTTSVAWISIAQRVLKERGLFHIIEEHANNLGGYIVRECYPSDRNVLMNHAEALFEIATAESMWKQHPDILVQLSKVIRKMGLYDSEKRKLIIKFIMDSEEKKYLEEESYANMYLGLFKNN